MMGYMNVSDTRKEIRHIIKRLKKDKQYEIIEISDICSNKKNPKFCHVTIKYQRKKAVVVLNCFPSSRQMKK